MNELPDSLPPMEKIRRTFQTIAGSYDGMHFLRITAERLVERAAIAPGDRVLDVATGTGLAAFAAAEAAGPGGSVTGLDFSAEMLEQARLKVASASQAGLERANLFFQEGSAESLPFADESFERVLCASSLFIIPDIPAALREARRVLVPGGRIAFSSFGPSFLQPLHNLLAARLQQHGLNPFLPATGRLPDPETCRRALAAAGFTEIEVTTEQLGYTLPEPAQRWAEIEAGMEGMPLRRLSADLRAQIQAEHLAELAAHADGKGIWVDVPAIFALGTK